MSAAAHHEVMTGERERERVTTQADDGCSGDGDGGGGGSGRGGGGGGRGGGVAQFGCMEPGNKHHTCPGSAILKLVRFLSNV